MRGIGGLFERPIQRKAQILVFAFEFIQPDCLQLAVNPRIWVFRQAYIVLQVCVSGIAFLPSRDQLGERILTQQFMNIVALPIYQPHQRFFDQ